MAKQNNNIGDQIRDAVQDAINSQDYSNLNNIISNTIGQATENISKGLNQARQAAKQAQDATHQSRGYAQNSGQGRKTFNEQWVNAPYQEQQRQRQQQMQELESVRNRYLPTTGVSGPGYAMAIAGGILAAGFAIGTILASISAMVFSGASALAVWMLVLMLVCIGVMITGVRRLGFANTFKRYVTVIGKRSFCDVKELASATGKTDETVTKDLQKMLAKGLFREGHMDRKQTCIMVTNEAYEQYVTAQKQLELRQKQEEIIEQNQPKKTEGPVSADVQAVLDEGNAYIAKIHASNDAIPGEEISQKISRMEMIVQKIFQRVKEHPEVIPDLKKMMDYYLPTTVKLLDAYEDLDRQPIQGENITSSKREIEKTLDTLNVAFEKLLDSIFKDVAWDVSTDISVLHTILAQEGLTKDDFSEKEKTL